MKNLKIASVVLFVGLTACNTKVADSTASDPAQLSTTGTPIVVTPKNTSIAANSSLQFVTTGGIPPYHYSTTSGPCSAGYLSGLLTSSGVSGTCLVQISDSSGAVTIATISVTGGTVTPSPTPTPVPIPTPIPTPLPTPTATNCTGILSQVNIALQDNSPSGLDSMLASAYIADPATCAGWCGTIQASACMWNPNPGSSAVCIAWPYTATLYTYQSSWQTYGGACTL